MTNKTITLGLAVAERIAATIEQDALFRPDDLEALRAALADPVPPAGGEPEVFAWSLDVPKPGQLGGIITTEFKESCVRADGSPGGFEHTVPLIRLSDHCAHVTRLQAEVAHARRQYQEMLDQAVSMMAQRDTLQSELTKARELLEEADNFMYIMTGHDSHARLIHQYGKEWWTPVNELRGKICTTLSNQSAPADKDPNQ